MRRLGRSVELLRWLTSDEQFISSTGRKGSIDEQRGTRTELNTCVVKFTLHDSCDDNLMEILSLYSIDTAHFCYALGVVANGKTVAQSDLFYDLKSPDLKPLLLSDESRIEVGSISNWRLVEGSGGQFAGVFQSDGNAIVELRSKSRLTFMKSESAADKVDHGFTFHLQVCVCGEGEGGRVFACTCPWPLHSQPPRTHPPPPPPPPGQRSSERQQPTRPRPRPQPRCSIVVAAPQDAARSVLQGIATHSSTALL